MSVQELHPPDHGTLTIAQYIEAVVVCNVFTLWLVVILQKDSSFFPSDSGTMRRALWPFFWVCDVMFKIKAWLASTYRRSRCNTLPYSTFDDEKL